MRILTCAHAHFPGDCVQTLITILPFVTSLDLVRKVLYNSLGGNIITSFESVIFTFFPEMH